MRFWQLMRRTGSQLTEESWMQQRNNELTSNTTIIVLFLVAIPAALLSVTLLIFAVDFSLYSLFGLSGFFAESNSCARSEVGASALGLLAAGIGFGLVPTAALRVFSRKVRLVLGCGLLLAVLALARGNAPVSVRFAIAAAILIGLVLTEPSEGGSRLGTIMLVGGGLVGLGIVFWTAAGGMPC
jgi:hypothetical protein